MNIELNSITEFLPNSFSEFIPVLFVLIIIGSVIYFQYRKHSLKKLKTEWIWNLTTTKVSKILEHYHSWNDDSSWYTDYYIVSKDNMWNEYKSDSYRDLESWWITEEELKSKKYNNKEYDLTSKDIIRQLDQEIINLAWEITTAWILKKVILKSNLFVLNEYKKLALTWPVPPYVVIKGH